MIVERLHFTARIFRPRRAHHYVLTLLSRALLLGVLLSGCAHTRLQDQYKKMRPLMLQGDWKTAAQNFESAKDDTYSEEDRVMYWLNAGTLLHYAHDFKRSSDYLVKAETAMQELWTQSVSAEISKFAINESMQSYAGEDFEKVLLYFYTSLNQALLGKVTDAVVEARRADELLKKMMVHFEKEGEGGTIYRQDAFMLWMVGLFYEIEGGSSLNDAYLAYKAAYRSYLSEYQPKFGFKVPSFVTEDVLRVAQLVGQEADAAQLVKKNDTRAELPASRSDAEGELIIFHGAGEAPYKEEYFFDAPTPDGYLIHAALPRFVAASYQGTGALIEGAGRPKRTEMAEPITRIVLKNFEHRLPAIQARAIARAVVKYGASQAAKQAAGGGKTAGGTLAGILTNVFTAVTEAADTRSWTTLPGSIGVARMWLPEGEHSLVLSFTNDHGAKIGASFPLRVHIKAKERSIVSVRSLL